MKLRPLDRKDLQEFVSEFLQFRVTVTAIILHSAGIVAINLQVVKMPRSPGVPQQVQIGRVVSGLVSPKRRLQVNLIQHQLSWARVGRQYSKNQ